MREEKLGGEKARGWGPAQVQQARAGHFHKKATTQLEAAVLWGLPAPTAGASGTRRGSRSPDLGQPCGVEKWLPALARSDLFPAVWSGPGLRG